MLHKNYSKAGSLLWCVLTVASCTNEDFDKGNNGPDVPEGLPVTLKLNIGTPEVPVVETKSLDNGATFGAINDLAVLVYDEKGENPIVTFHDVEGENQTSVNNMTSMPRPASTRSMCWQMSVLRMLQKNIQRNKLCYPNKLNLKDRWEQK